MNHVALVGRIVRELILRKSSNGNPYTFFVVAVNTIPDHPDFISCVAWNKVAENMVNYLTKGSLISVSGRISRRKSEGKEEYITEVVANSVTFLDNRKRDSLVDQSINNNNYVKQPEKENKINLNEAFKTPSPSYNTGINFVNSEIAKQETNNSTIIDSSFDDDEEAIVWGE